MQQFILRYVAITALMIAAFNLTKAQSVGVGTSSPHSSALFHIESTPP